MGTIDQILQEAIKPREQKTIVLDMRKKYSAHIAGRQRAIDFIPFTDEKEFSLTSGGKYAVLAYGDDLENLTKAIEVDVFRVSIDSITEVLDQDWVSLASYHDRQLYSQLILVRVV